MKEPQAPLALELSLVTSDLDKQNVEPETDKHPDESIVVVENIGKRTKPHRDDRVWYDWLSSLNFWKICLIYMMSRLYVNVTQVYTPLYLQETLRLAKVCTLLSTTTMFQIDLISATLLSFPSSLTLLV